MDNLVLNYYGFSQKPFSKSIGKKGFFLTESHNKALGMLELGIQNEDIILLSGPVGIGKSVVLQNLIQEMDTNIYTPVYIRGTNLSEGDLYKILLNELNIETPHFASSAKRIFFKKIPELNKKPIVILDDAQELKDSALHGLKSMVNFDCDSKTRITFILSGQPELVGRIKMSYFMPIRQRINLSYPMCGLSLEETCKYIDHHTKLCNCTKVLFSDAAKAEIFKQSQGVPRIINALCYNALIGGAVKKNEIIDTSNLVIPELFNF